MVSRKRRSKYILIALHVLVLIWAGLVLIGIAHQPSPGLLFWLFWRSSVVAFFGLISIDLALGLYAFLKKKSFIGLLAASGLLAVALVAITVSNYSRSIPEPQQLLCKTGTDLVCPEQEYRDLRGWPSTSFYRLGFSAGNWEIDNLGVILDIGFWWAVSLGMLVGVRLIATQFLKPISRKARKPTN